MRSPRFFLVGATAGVLALAACSSAAAPTGAPTLAVPTAAAPTLALPTGALPTDALPTTGLPGSSIAIPSFNSDPELEAIFPKTIAGQPVTNIQSARFLDVLTAFGSSQDEVQKFVAAMQAVGIDASRVAFASGSVQLNGNNVQIQALRTPGGEAAKAITQLAAVFQSTVPPLKQATVGGKSVLVDDAGDGTGDYYYANGEIAWFLSSVDAATAETVFSALP